MKIRAGYSISYDCPQPTPMILQVSVHPTRQPDLITWDGLQIDPAIPANTYHDTFGNFCHVIRAPAGRLTLSTDFMVQDSGALDPVVPDAMAHPLEELPPPAAPRQPRIDQVSSRFSPFLPAAPRPPPNSCSGAQTRPALEWRRSTFRTVDTPAVPLRLEWRSDSCLIATSRFGHVIAS